MSVFQGQSQRASITKNGGDSRKSKGSISQMKHPSVSEHKTFHLGNKNIQLMEDNFGYVIDEVGKQHYIKRFTWKNHNSIQAQVITYGARITSLKLPNRKGISDDVALGFDDIAGYLHYGDLYMGATIGRVTDKIEKSTFSINKKQFWLTSNSENHHYNGGFKGLDKYVWASYVSGSTVTMSCVSHDLDEGYPGDLFVEVSFELTPKNEFHINMEARATKTTPVNLSHLLYFNLGGHGGQREEAMKHIITINANCGLIMRDDGLPNGKIQNVIYTRDDFQIPQVMKDKLPNDVDDGFESYMCVNRGTGQELCFVARAIHPPSGRVLEMYSNQCGVRFSTADHFGPGLINIPVCVEEKTSCSLMAGSIFELLDRLQGYVAETLTIDSQTDYLDLKKLICKFRKRIKLENGEEEGVDEEEKFLKFVNPEDYLLEEGEEEGDEDKIDNLLTINPMQAKYLEGMYIALSTRDSVTSYTEIGTVIKEILDTAIILDPKGETPIEGSANVEAELTGDAETRSRSNGSGSKKSEEAEMKRKGTIRLENKIPSFYKDGRIHGKNDAIYRKQGALCFQSENYPNAVYHKNFPKSVLNPGEIYKHSIVYKFWVQSGNATRWIRRNFPLPTA